MSTSVSSPNADPKSTVKKNRTVKRWITVFSSLAVVLLLFIIIRTQGYVSGYEFSPTHFQQRTFSFYEIPLIHLQITPIRRKSATPKTAIYVRQNALITPHTGPPTDWHLVSISRGLTGSTPADASLLIDQLQLGTSAGSDYWRTWSIDHPNQAKVLWATIQKLAERELYILMPTLFELAQIDQSAHQLQQSIDQRLRKDYYRLVQDMHSAGREDLAQSLLDEAVKDYPDDQPLQNLRLDPAS